MHLLVAVGVLHADATDHRPGGALGTRLTGENPCCVHTPRCREAGLGQAPLRPGILLRDTLLRDTLHRDTLSIWISPTQASLLTTQRTLTTLPDLVDLVGLTQGLIKQPFKDIRNNLMDGKMLPKLVQCMGKGLKTQVNTIHCNISFVNILYMYYI